MAKRRSALKGQVIPWYCRRIMDRKGRLRATFEVYQARDGYRWRLSAANGHIIADSGEAYTRPSDVDRAIARLADLLISDNVVWGN